MKAAPFEYSRAVDIDEACGWLAADEGARVIAGGQSLVPMMAMRLARPTRIVDINRLEALSYIRDEDGAIAIGATTRQYVAEQDALIANKLPLLARVIPHVGHAATRARGTIGGSIAHADPAGELPLVAVTLDARMRYRTHKKDTDTAACDFYVGPMATSLPNDACLTSIRFPVWLGKVGVGFHEVNARSSDFAFVSAAAQLALDDERKVKRIAIGIGAATDIPIRLTSAEQQLTGTVLDEKSVQSVLHEALAGVDLLDELHASAAYRRRAAVVLAARSIADALADANGGKAHAH